MGISVFNFYYRLKIYNFLNYDNEIFGYINFIILYFLLVVL